MSSEEKVFFDVAGVGKYLNASLSTIYKLAQNGEIPCQKMGRQWRFSRAEIDRWIANREGFARNAAAKKSGGNASEVKSLSEEFFNEDQRQIMKAFGIGDITKLMAMLASSRRRAGVEALLGMSSEELDDVVEQICERMK